MRSYSERLHNIGASACGQSHAHTRRQFLRYFALITKHKGSAGSAAAVPHGRQQRESLRDPNITAARLQRIENLAMHDELTGVFNRRFLMEAIRKEDHGRAPLTFR